MNIIWLAGGVLDVIGRQFVHINTCVRPVIAPSGITIILEQVCDVSRRAVELTIERNIFVFCIAGNTKKLLLSVPAPGTYRNLSKQLKFQSNILVRTTIASHMIRERFGYHIHPNRGINVMRGAEGNAVREIYFRLAAEYGISWQGRDTSGKWGELSPINRAISLCNSVLYNFTEIAVIRAGCSPYWGFIHGVKGKSQKSLVYDIADMVKFDVITPIAFYCVADGRPHPEWRARAACIRLFRSSNLLNLLTKTTKDVLRVGEKCIARRASLKSK
ncbi:TPA: CRISPR-associated endonuclease Cas1 [Escherichia coli]